MQKIIWIPGKHHPKTDFIAMSRPILPLIYCIYYTSWLMVIAPLLHRPTGYETLAAQGP